MKFAVITIIAVLILNVAGQHRRDYDHHSRYRYDWQPRQRHGIFHSRTGYDRNRYDSKNDEVKESDLRGGRISYRETSYGFNQDVDPYTRRALENSFHPHTSRRSGERSYQPRAEPRYKQREEATREETSGSGDDECAMMKDPRGAMDSSMMEEGCRSYKAWGKAMKEPMKWEPTKHQMDWWKSLSMSMDERKSYYRRRHKRQATQALPLRKEYRAMTDRERRAFHNAVRGLKTNSMDGRNMYDIFVGFHQSQMAPGSHFGCAFYPWHREMLLRFENALQTIDPSVTIPYLDTNMDFHLGDDYATQTVTFTEDFAGNGDGRVIIGPFADWTLPFPVDNRRFLFRNLTFAPNARTPPALMSDQAISTILNAPQLQNICFTRDSSFETFHGATHNWMGGVMVNLPSSPSDPLFFLHHAFVDCLWTWMRENQRSRGIDVDFDYPNDTISMGVGMRRLGDGRRIQSPEDSLHYSLAEMRPFGPLRNIDGLSSIYDDTVGCAPRPTCSRSDTSCGGSDYLFCDESTYRCAPKLRLGAQCRRFARYSPCSGGTCCNGICRRTCNAPGPRREPTTRNEVPDRPTRPDRRPEERPSRPVEVRPRPMAETMHGVSDDSQNEAPRQPVTPPEPRRPPREQRPVDIPEVSQPEIRNVEPPIPDDIPESATREQSPRENIPEVRQPEQLPEETQSNEHSDFGFPAAHPGVPTHAPYVVPTLPPVPTHPPYVVRQAPTHPPGFGIHAAVPTHPPSASETSRQMVKRDRRSKNNPDREYPENSRPYKTAEEYENRDQEDRFFKDSEEYRDEYSNRYYRENRDLHYSERNHIDYEDPYYGKSRYRGRIGEWVDRDRENIGYKDIYDREHPYHFRERQDYVDDAYNRKFHK